MNVHTFLSLELKYGDFIYIVTEKGEGFSGNYENDYNSSNETFKFSNFSNGKTEIIYVDKLQHLSKQRK